jgi:1,4-alpha-glucan branching enzyme
MTTPATLSDELARVACGEHRDPHRVLGPHADGDRVVVRVFRPDAASVDVVTASGRVAATCQVDGLFEAALPGPQVPDYRIAVTRDDGTTFEVDDPYRFWPTVGELDLHLFGEGRHRSLWRMLGARPLLHDGVAGTAFSVWAPNARSVRIAGDFNDWDDRLHPMRQLGSSGVWELFIPQAGSGDHYKYIVVDAWGHPRPKADPMATATEVPPGNASRVYASQYEWHDDEWMQRRRDVDPLREPQSTYEVHLGSWRRCPEEGDRPL